MCESRGFFRFVQLKSFCDMPWYIHTRTYIRMCMHTLMIYSFPQGPKGWIGEPGVDGVPGGNGTDGLPGLDVCN